MPIRHWKPLLASCAATLALMAGPALGNDRPPANAQPLSVIIANLERQGFGPFDEIEFDDGVWEIEVYRDGRKRKLKVHPVSGSILSDRPDD